MTITRIWILTVVVVFVSVLAADDLYQHERNAVLVRALEDCHIPAEMCK